MDAAHIHLILNHFPLAGLVISLLLLGMARWQKSEELARVGKVAVFLTGLVTIPTFLTGEPAEELIEHLPGISEQLIHAHEEAAEKTVWIIGATALAALGSLIAERKSRASPRWAIPVVALLSLVSVGLLAWTSNLGGQISHPEIRHLN